MRLEELRGLGPGGLLRRAFRSIEFRLAEMRWRRRRDAFAAAAPERYRREFSSEALDGVRVYSFCGQRDLPLQVLSILSFLRHVGIPRSWTVVSDGSFTAEHESRIRSLHPAVGTAPWTEFLRENTRGIIGPYAARYPLGKKLALITALPVEGTSLYVDSDVIFFAGGVHLRELLRSSRENHFLRDVGNAVVDGLATPEEKALAPINSGFLIQNQPLNWTDPLARLATREWSSKKTHAGLTAQHFLEQTVAHVAYHAAGAHQLDPSKYVVSFADAFDPRDRFSHSESVLRHYVWHTRLKFWSHVPEYLD